MNGFSCALLGVFPDNIRETVSAWYHFLVSEQMLEYVPNIVVALILGFLIGLERRARHKSAGVRTYMVIAASSALITLCGVAFTQDVPGGDPTRLAGQILSGIGMIGAGVILRRGFTSSGVTTAAMILLAVGAGIGCGFGIFTLSTTAVILVLLSVTITGKYVGSNEWAPPVKVVCKMENSEAIMQQFGRNSLLGGFDKSKGGEGYVEFTVQPHISPKDCEALLERMLQNPDILSAEFVDAD